MNCLQWHYYEHFPYIFVTQMYLSVKLNAKHIAINFVQKLLFSFPFPLALFSEVAENGPAKKWTSNKYTDTLYIVSKIKNLYKIENFVRTVTSLNLIIYFVQPNFK